MNDCPGSLYDKALHYIHKHTDTNTEFFMLQEICFTGSILEWMSLHKHIVHFMYLLFVLCLNKC